MRVPCVAEPSRSSPLALLGQVRARASTVVATTKGPLITLHLAHVDGARFVLASADDSAIARIDAVTAVRQGGDFVTLHLATGGAVSILVSPGRALSFSTEETPDLVSASPASWQGLMWNGYDSFL